MIGDFVSEKDHALLIQSLSSKQTPNPDGAQVKANPELDEALNKFFQVEEK